MSTPQRSEHDKDSDAPCDENDGSVLPEEYTVLLLAKVKKLLATWANEEQMNGNSDLYRDLRIMLQQEIVVDIANKVPTTMDELAILKLQPNIVLNYGERLVKCINMFIKHENLMGYTKSGGNANDNAAASNNMGCDVLDSDDDDDDDSENKEN